MEEQETHCSACQQIAKLRKSSKKIVYQNLRHFYERYSDDLLTHYYHICQTCGQIWREDECDYPADSGYFWVAQTVAELLAWEAEMLPTDVEKSDAGIRAWIELLERPYYAGLF